MTTQLHDEVRADGTAPAPAPAEASEPREFDADERSRRAARPVTIGGKTYETRRKGKAIKRILLELTPTPEEEKSTDPAVRAKNVERMYVQAQILLVDPETGENPTMEELDELDFDVVQELVGFIWGESAQAALAETLAETVTPPLGEGAAAALARPPSGGDETVAALSSPTSQPEPTPETAPPSSSDGGSAPIGASSDVLVTSPVPQPEPAPAV